MLLQVMVQRVGGKAPAADCKLFEVVAEGAFELWTSGSRQGILSVSGWRNGEP